MLLLIDSKLYSTLSHLKTVPNRMQKYDLFSSFVLIRNVLHFSDVDLSLLYINEYGIYSVGKF